MFIHGFSSILTYIRHYSPPIHQVPKRCLGSSPGLGKPFANLGTRLIYVYLVRFFYFKPLAICFLTLISIFCAITIYLPPKAPKIIVSNEN